MLMDQVIRIIVMNALFRSGRSSYGLSRVSHIEAIALTGSFLCQAIDNIQFLSSLQFFDRTAAGVCRLLG